MITELSRLQPFLLDAAMTQKVVAINCLRAGVDELKLVVDGSYQTSVDRVRIWSVPPAGEGAGGLQVLSRSPHSGGRSYPHAERATAQLEQWQTRLADLEVELQIAAPAVSRDPRQVLRNLGPALASVQVAQVERQEALERLEMDLEIYRFDPEGVELSEELVAIEKNCISQLNFVARRQLDLQRQLGNSNDGPGVDGPGVGLG